LEPARGVFSKPWTIVLVLVIVLVLEFPSLGKAEEFNAKPQRKSPRRKVCCGRGFPAPRKKQKKATDEHG
jgi:hypothetical protein